MKRLVLFVMLIMCVGAVSAQQRWSLTPEIGMTAIKAGGGHDPYSQVWNARWKVGVGVEYQIKPDFFSLKSGLYYTQRGQSNGYMTYGNYGGSGLQFGSARSMINRHFLQVPVLANFSFKLSDDVRLNLAAGPYIAYSMGDRYSSCLETFQPIGEGYGGGNNGYSYGYGFTSSYEGNKGVSHDNPFDWGLSFQVGLEVKNWVFTAGYDASLGKEYKGGPIDMKYNTFSLSVGYKFKMGK